MLATWTTSDTSIVVIANTAALVLFLLWQFRKTRQLADANTAQLLRNTELTEQNVALLDRVQDEWRFQHRQGTYVGTIHGLWKVLALGLEQGGLDEDLCRSIYAAGDEMFEAFYAENNHADTGATLRQERPVMFE